MPGGWGTPSWMGGEPEVGETFVQGKDQATARALLAAAEDLGIDPLAVRTVSRGFIVPNAVWDAAQETLRADTDADI
ncbi:hypothetical protein Pam4_24 [Pseudanabaena phage Pam4]|nr:hypothetical protein Pam4_24 [Pseudanabaena phage Pam4]